MFGAMEPLMPDDTGSRLGNTAVSLVAAANSLAGQLHPLVSTALSDLVRSMNCYYSNLIEDHHTHPRDIDRALAHDFSQKPEQRNLQKEAVAHIEVQRLIDSGQTPDCEPTHPDFLRWLHYEFCSRLPDDLLYVKNEKTGERIPVIPGELRTRAVSVGRHDPPDPEKLPELLERFAVGYNSSNLNRVEQIVSVAASHHRLLWIHPFLDGNGRVTRLMSHALLRRYGVGSSLWSAARGLARNVDDYKKLLQAADEPRRGDLDGRGQLTNSGLRNFCAFFLEKACLDQVTFMADLLQPGSLMTRIETYAEREISGGTLPKGSVAVLREALLCGELSRSRAAELTGYKERMARDAIATLMKKKLLVSEGARNPLRLGFPIDVVEYWFPRLYPASSSLLMP